MGKHKSKDYKLSAVRYYKTHEINMRDMCEILIVVRYFNIDI